ncbi:14030_t:CDS:1, partial [Cetraspora pellucida]
NSDNFNKAKSGLTHSKQAFIDINKNFSYIDILQLLTVLDILKNKSLID